MKQLIANINIFFFWFSKIWQNFGAFHWNINFFLLNIHKNELCFSSSGRPNLKGQVCKLASRNGNFFPRLIFCSLKQKVAALLHFTVPLCFCVEVVGATIIYKSWELGFLIITYSFLVNCLRCHEGEKKKSKSLLHVCQIWSQLFWPNLSYFLTKCFHTTHNCFHRPQNDKTIRFFCTYHIT